MYLCNMVNLAQQLHINAIMRLTSYRLYIINARINNISIIIIYYYHGCSLLATYNLIGGIYGGVQ